MESSASVCVLGNILPLFLPILTKEARLLQSVLRRLKLFFIVQRCVICSHRATVLRFLKVSQRRIVVCFHYPQRHQRLLQAILEINIINEKLIVSSFQIDLL